MNIFPLLFHPTFSPLSLSPSSLSSSWVEIQKTTPKLYRHQNWVSNVGCLCWVKGAVGFRSWHSGCNTTWDSVVSTVNIDSISAFDAGGFSALRWSWYVKHAPTIGWILILTRTLTWWMATGRTLLHCSITQSCSPRPPLVP